MIAGRIALVVAIVVIASSVGIGTATSAPSSVGLDPAQTTETPVDEAVAPAGEHLSAVMQSNAAQAGATVENEMWTAAYANTSNESVQRDLVERRAGALNGSLAELQAERRALRAAFENGTIDRITYRAQLSSIVGRLAAFDKSVGDAHERGQAVGVNTTRLDELRSGASELGGPEVSRLARNLTGGPGPPDFLGDDHPAGERGPGGGANGADRGPAGVADGNVVPTSTPTATPTPDETS